MSSKPTSKWSTNDDDEAEAAALRKKEKEEKRRLKEEKARKAAAAPTPIDDPERPPKRQRTLEDESNQSPDEGANLLQFQTRRFGPCGHVDQFELLNNIEEGSYGLVSRARRKDSGQIVALKRLKMDYTNDGFPVTGLREIQTLKACNHPHVVDLIEVVMGDSLKE
jgi:cell division cycle 2-like protein